MMPTVLSEPFRALQGSNLRPLPCKGRQEQRSDQQFRRWELVSVVTGVPVEYSLVQAAP